MADSPSPSKPAARQALLKNAQDAGPSLTTASTSGPKPVKPASPGTGAGAGAGAATGTGARSGGGWGPALLLGVVQLALLGGAVAWGWGLLNDPARQGASAGSPAVAGGGGPDTAALQRTVELANAKIAALQRQIDAQNEERQKTQSRLQEMADRMALVIQQSAYVPGGQNTRATSDEASQVAAMLPSVTPATSELILIKERNRLTSYADEAIATGSRAALQALVDAMLDPGMKHLVHAAQAEFKRVQAYYDMGIGIDPGYTLPVRELFKDQPVAREADLSPAQLHGLMLDLKQPWEARLRAAFLLRGSSEGETNAQLIKVLKEDPVLDVAKQAQITFENRVGRKFRLFDIPAIEAWWQAQGGSKPAVKMLEPGNR